MKHKLLLRTMMALLTLMGSMATLHAEQVTLAAWDFAADVKYTATQTDGTKTYYTATADT